MPITQVTAILSLIDAIMGSEMAKGVLALFKQDPNLTAAQKAVLDDHFADLQLRKARLEAEIADQA